MGGPFHILDDVFSVLTLTVFSVIQALILHRFVRHLKKGDFHRTSSKSTHATIFGVAHVALAAGAILCSILAITTFMIKLGLATKFLEPFDDDARQCAYGGEPIPLDRYGWWFACLTYGGKGLRVAARVIDFIIGEYVQLLLALSDGMLLYRCFVVLPQPWVYYVIVASTLRSIWLILGVTTVALEGQLMGTITTYVSLTTIVFGSAALVGWLHHMDKEASQPIGAENGPYKKLMRVVLEAACLPLVIGIIHIGLASRRDHPVPVSVNALWFSVVILGCQSITLRSFKLGLHGVITGVAYQPISLPVTVEYGVPEARHPPEYSGPASQASA